MKYFIDTEFIEGFSNWTFAKNRHFIDLISIGIVADDRREYYAISNEYNYKDANDWVKENVILPLYINTVHGDMRNKCDVTNFHKIFGKKNKDIAAEILNFFGCWRDVLFYRAPEGIDIYGYYADYDWVLFCSLFGRMIDLPKGFPMYCKDLKQMLDEKAILCMEKPTPDEILSYREAVRELGGGFSTAKKDISFEQSLERIKSESKYPKQENEHNSLADAKWDKKLYDFLQVL